MEKAAVALVTALAVALAIGIFAAQPAQARATVSINQVGCGMVDEKGGTVQVLASEIITQSSNNNITLICKAELKNTTGKAIRWDAFNHLQATPDSPARCEDGSGNKTIDWKEVISPSGQATMTCHFKS